MAYVVAYSVGTLAPTPGGLGAVEGLMIALFVSFGVPSAMAVAVVLIYRIINFWLPIPPGFMAYAVVRPGRRPVAEGEVGRRPTRLRGSWRGAASDRVRRERRPAPRVRSARRPAGTA